MKSRVGPTRREVIGSAGAGLVFRMPDGDNVLPKITSVTNAAATAGLFINGLKSGIAPIPGGDEFWVRVFGGVGAQHGRLWVKDATHNTVQTFWGDIPGGTSDWVLRATNDSGTALPPGAYTLMLASPYPSVAAV